MSEVNGAGAASAPVSLTRPVRPAHPARPARPTGEAATAVPRTPRRRFAEWRAYRRETKFARQEDRRTWADQIPPWAFGILHR